MTTSEPTGRANTNPYAIPLADLDAVRVTQTQMVELMSDGHRPPPDNQTPTVGDWSADADGE
jgi:hypothetical protein